MLSITPTNTRHFLATVAIALSLACSGGGGSSSSTPVTPTGPNLTTSPLAQAGYVGDLVTFRVVAEGAGNTYQWLRNGTAIPSASATTLVLPVAVVDDQARYSVRVTASGGGITTSPEALLDVLYANPAVVAGHDHTLAITTKGRVYAWGVGGNGQLGMGDYQGHMTPTVVPLPGPAVQVAAGWGHSLALLADGRLYAWGNNTSGQLGDGTTTMRNTPALVPGFSNTLYITCGYNHNLAVKSDNSVWMWGYNSHGQLGQGDKVNRLSAVSLPVSATQIADVALGELHTLIVDTANNLYGMGDNAYGQLGLTYSPTTEHLTITQLLTGGVASVRAFSLYSTFIGTNGLPYGTGENVYGPLGDGSAVTRYGWVAMGTAGLPAGNTLAAVVPGQYHTLLLGNQGGVASVGYNWYGQLGLNTTNPTQYTTSQAIPGLAALSVAAGSQSSYAVLPDLTVKAWGYNSNGRLGDGTATHRSAPVTLPAFTLGPVPTGVATPGIRSATLAKR